VVELFFFDTSAIVKRYIREIGSPWVLQMIVRQPTVRVVLSRITWVEVLSALSRLQRESAIREADLSREVRAFRQHFRTEYEIAEFDRAVSILASELVRRHPLRAYDAVQLASALRLQKTYRSTEGAHLTFVSADQRLVSVAINEGLTVVNPIEQE
jgi:predicted nucleic acid-binding protein